MVQGYNLEQSAKMSLKKGRKRQSKYSPEGPDPIEIQVWWSRMKHRPWRPCIELLPMVAYLINAPRFRGLERFKQKESD